MVTFSAIASIVILGGAIVIAVGGAAMAGFIVHKKSASKRLSQ